MDKVKGAELIRAFIDALEASQLHLAGATSEEEVKELTAESMKGE
ncbi:MAG: hypothetical protein V1792_15545 [Pseudomonadota bacterium]